jgi:hypothetical protein
MKRLRRNIFDALTALSLLLCMATAGLWVRSFWRSLQVEYTNDWRIIELSISRGELNWDVWTAKNSALPSDLKGWRYYWGRPTKLEKGPFRGAWWWSAGFSHFSHDLPRYHFESVAMPLWGIMLLTILAPLQWTIAHAIMRKGRRHGFCAVCVYDLRATPDRCSECGAIPDKAKA